MFALGEPGGVLFATRSCFGVRTQLFGTKSHFVPLAGAAPAREDVQVQFTKEQVKEAPGIADEGKLSQEAEEATLYRHYGLEYSKSRSESGLPAAAAGEGGQTGVSSGDDAMTRSEEELRVGKAQRERGRARLRKYVVTEVQQTVPVKRERARLEREPITDENIDDATARPDLSENEHEVVLSEEEVIVEKRTVPKARVRMTKDVETDERDVSEEVRKERIEAEGDVDR